MTTPAGEQETGGTGLGHREVRMTRTAKGEFDVTNVRGGVLHLGNGEDESFTPVELLLTALAGCSAVDVDFITGKRVEPVSFDATASGTKVRDEQGNHLADIELTFTVRFPPGEAGDRAREMLPRAVQMSHDRLCTVTRTVVLGTPVTSRAG